MADMSRFSESESKHLKAKDFLGKNLKVVIRDVQFVEFDATPDQKAQTKSVLLFEGKEKGLILNPTNNDVLCKAYGKDGDEWIGKTIALSTQEYDKYPPGWIVAALDIEFDDAIPF